VRFGPRLALAVAAVMALWEPATAPAGAAPPDTSGTSSPRWIPAQPLPADTAAADTAGAPYVMPRFEVVRPTRSEADSMTLREIIDRCVEGEKTKLAGHHDMTSTASVRTLLLWKKKKLVADSAFLLYQDDDGFTKTVRLGESRRKYKLDGGNWVPEKDDEKKDSEVSVEFSNEGKGLSEVPFFLEDQQDYDFTLLERNLEGNHVIFKIAFEPRSSFKPLPSGTVYVDTNDFRIIHEVFTFDKQNPFPLLLKGVRRISREWRRLPTGEWVVSRVMAELDLHGSWTGFIPERVTVALVMDDYRFDQGYDPARFGKR
jgi:hypothetical protein